MREAAGRGLQQEGAGGQHGQRASRWQGELGPSTGTAAYEGGTRFPSQQASHWAEGCCPEKDVVAEPEGRQAG